MIITKYIINNSIIQNMKRILFLLAVLAFAAAFVACEKDINEEKLYKVTVNAGEGGTVAGDNGEHKEGTILTFYAIPDKGYSFSCWSDGIKSNPRAITVNTDVILVALFAKNDTNNGENINENNGENNGENNNEQNADNNTRSFTLGCWYGTLPIRDNQDSQNYSNQFFFFDENGVTYGMEESYYRGRLDNTYDFLWEWNDDSHSVLIINYGGNWAENKCCIDIQEFNEDHIYGYFYKTMVDYESNHKSNSGTKVELKHLDIEEQFKFEELTVIANSDGTIDVYGHIETNVKLKEFALYNIDGSVAYDFLEQNEQLKEKNKTLNADGWAIKKPFVLDVKSFGKLPVAQYTLRIKTKKNSSFEASFGTDYSFKVGTGANTTLGAQISLVDQRCYMLGDFYDRGTGEVNDIAKTIELFLGGYDDMLHLESAKNLKIANTTNDVRTQAIADANKAKLADARVFENVVVTSTDCIATYKLTKVDDTTYELSGVMINSKGNYKVDVYSCFY